MTIVIPWDLISNPGHISSVYTTNVTMSHIMAIGDRSCEYQSPLYNGAVID